MEREVENPYGWKIAAWQPYFNVPKETRDGATTLEYLGWYVVVSVFSYPGGEHGAAFTLMECYFGGLKYSVRFPKAYHKRWFGRLANRFEHNCYLDVKKRNAL